MTVDQKTDENDEDGDWCNDEDDDENDDNPFNSYELDDQIINFEQILNVGVFFS